MVCEIGGWKMGACLQELNNVVANMDEKLIYMVIGYAKDIQIKNNDKRKIGIADGKYSIPDDIDFCNDEIREMFEV